MSYADSRTGKKPASLKLKSGSPMNAGPKSLRNPPNSNGAYPTQVSLGKGNQRSLGGSGKSPSFDLGVAPVGRRPGISVGNSTQVPKFTSSPFSGRSNMGAGGRGQMSGSKAYGNKKSNNAP